MARETHGLSKTRFYSCWRNMKSRCKAKKGKNYQNYTKKKNVFVCKKWEKFEGFYEDMYKLYCKHAKKHGEEQTTLDRIDNNKGYNKENCRWATYAVQNRNHSLNNFITYKGRTKTYTDWSNELGLKKSFLWSRINRSGWSIKRAFETPLQKPGEYHKYK